MPAHELAKVIVNGARADIPKYTAAQVLKVMEGWPCIYCRAASARVASKGIGSSVELHTVGQVFSVDNKDGYALCLYFGMTDWLLYICRLCQQHVIRLCHKNHDASH